MSKGRKHGIFAVSGDVVVMPTKKKEERKDVLTLEAALNTVFQQMRIAGNRPRTIDSNAYIVEQFASVCSIEYIEDINLDKLYHYLDVLEVTPATKLIRLKSIKAVLGKFYNNGWIKDRFWSNIQSSTYKLERKCGERFDAC
ncbi:MAG: hypothetical protein RR595_03990 [Lysinibacillus sp.]